MHNIQPRAGDNIKDFTAINMWYQRLDERYNFSLGEAILPLMTTDSLIKLATLDPPFLQNREDIIYQQSNMSRILVGMISMTSALALSLIFLFRREPSPSEPPSSLDIKLEFCIYPVLCLQDPSQLFKRFHLFGRHRLSPLHLLPPHHSRGPALLRTHRK